MQKGDKVYFLSFFEIQEGIVFGETLASRLGAPLERNMWNIKGLNMPYHISDLYPTYNEAKAVCIETLKNRILKLQQRLAELEAE